METTQVFNAQNPTLNDAKSVKQDFTLYVAVPAVDLKHVKHLEQIKLAIDKALEGYVYSYHVANPDSLGLQAIVDSFNRTIEDFLKSGADYLFWVEADNVIPPHAFTTLFAHGVDVAGGIAPYHKIAPVYENLMVAGRFLSEGSYRTVNLHREDIVGKVIDGDVWAGTTCLLIKRHVFTGGLRFIHNKELAGLDLLFWKALKTHGFKFLIDGNVVCEDLG